MRVEKSVILALIGLLFFIWPVAHTITVRESVIFLSLIMLVHRLYRNKDLHLSTFRELKPALIIYAALTAWILIQAVFISRETAWALKEIRSQWGMSTLTLAIGLFLGFSEENDGVLTPRRILSVLFWLLTVHILYIDWQGVLAISDIWRTGGRIMGLTSGSVNVSGLTEGPDKSSYLTAFFMAFLSAEVVFRTVCGKRCLSFGAPLLILFIILAFFSAYVEGFRCIAEAEMFLLLTPLLLYFSKFNSYRHRVLILMGLILPVFLTGFAVYKLDKRWQNLFETVPIAFDTEGQTAWRNMDGTPVKNLESGEPVNISNYLRLAWIKEGVRISIKNPLGVGFGRNAFGHGMKAEYPNEQISIGHSHSGLLDLLIGIGVPGAALWLAFLFSIMYIGGFGYLNLRSNNEAGYFALLAFLITASYGVRMLIDSVTRDHMIQQFIFLAGLSLALMARAKKRTH